MSDGTASTAPLLELKQIRKAFGAVQALRGVSFDVRAGEVHALLGENGAGKSTLIKVITGAHQPDAGEFRFAGESVHALSPARAHELGIACIYQQPALFPDLTVAENIALRLRKPRWFGRVRHEEQVRTATALLECIGAHISVHAEVRSLSMPEQQLVEIACALGAGARLVIMDEPTASLTRTEQHLLYAVVRDLKTHGVGVVYITHRLEEIFALADRVTVLRDGESVGTNTPESLTEAQLIRLMVGREVDRIYPPAENSPGEVRLRLVDVGCASAGVEGIHLEARAGEIVGLAGLVGAGRTELARILFGLTPADAGEIWLDGQRVTIRSPREAMSSGIAYVPEDRRRHGVVLEMAIGDNVTMAAQSRLFPTGLLRPSRERAVAVEYIQRLGVKTPGAQVPVGALSGGNQQKVSLARWLATKPKLLILDEPTQGVDVGAKSEIHGIIRQLAAQGLAVLLISSDLPEVLGMSDRIAVMRSGRLVQVLSSGEADPQRVMAAALGRTEEAAA
jgi:rhamnose transport system ATP-binding protein